MARIDDNFISMCRDILENGTTTEGQKVRPHWEDGPPAYTIKKFGVVTRYNLGEEFPILTLRKTPAKSAFDEILWIYQEKSNNVHDLHSDIWNAWADEKGTIGRAYGYQMAVKHLYRDITRKGIEKAFGDVPIPEMEDGPEKLRPEESYLAVLHEDEFRHTRAIYDRTKKAFYMDQMDRVLYDLVNNPFSRRIMTNLYDFEDLHEMHLYPCAYSMTFNVTQRKEDGKLVLNGILNQRSQDTLTAFAWNEAQYGILLAVIAQCVGMEAGEFVHVIADAHIYDRHVDAVKELISRTPKPAPKVWINPEKHSFYEFTRDDIKLENYETAGDQIRNIPVAI